MEKEKNKIILCSACLLGVKCRYDGKSKPNQRVIRLSKKAILKQRSPSCGCGAIYDGTFSGKRRI